jgi:hypothetical protein
MVWICIIKQQVNSFSSGDSNWIYVAGLLIRWDRFLSRNGCNWPLYFRKYTKCIILYNYFEDYFWSFAINLQIYCSLEALITSNDQDISNSEAVSRLSTALLCDRRRISCVNWNDEKAFCSLLLYLLMINVRLW